MPSITTWSRLEPNVRGASQSETLKARIYDPLWLLARQWQLGELQGDDNGTPVSARLRAECAELTRYVPQGGAATPVKFDPKKVPLETLVEHEAVHPEPGTLVRLRVSVEAGQHFLRLLRRAPFGTKYHQGFIAVFPLPPRSAALSADVMAKPCDSTITIFITITTDATPSVRYRRRQNHGDERGDPVGVTDLQYPIVVLDQNTRNSTPSRVSRCR